MKQLITGTAGLIGSHLGETLIAEGYDIVATYLNPTIDLAEIADTMALVRLDVTDFDAVTAVVAEHRPAVIYHLAAQSLPTVSWVDPWTTMQANVIGTVNVFEAIKKVKKLDADYDPMVVVACSSAEYGASLTPERVPITEDAPLMPMHPYGVSKVGQDLLTFQYWVNDRIRGIRARLFNCTGPRKQNDVVSDFGSAHRESASAWRHAEGRQSFDAARDHRRSRHGIGPAASRRTWSAWRGLQYLRRAGLLDPGGPGYVYRGCRQSRDLGSRSRVARVRPTKQSSSEARRSSGRRPVGRRRSRLPRRCAMSSNTRLADSPAERSRAARLLAATDQKSILRKISRAQDRRIR